MAEYDVIICGSGSGGGFLAGEIAAKGSVLILESGPHVKGDANPGVGSPERRKYSTQMTLGNYIPDGMYAVNAGKSFYSYPLYADASTPTSFVILREAKIVGGGSQINVGAWLRPWKVDFDGFAAETGVTGWSKDDFMPHFEHAERTLNVHRNKRDHWNPASVIYEQTARSLGIPTVETASNRKDCIFCGHRNNAGMPCKYDSLMSTAMTQIPRAMQAGATLVDNATVVKVEITDNRATGVIYRKDGQLVTAKARKLVVVAAGAIGTPLILFNSGVNEVNPNVGRYLRAHPGISVEAWVPGNDWNSDRGYQWNVHHFLRNDDGSGGDAVVHASASFPTTSHLSCQVGDFGRPYKDLMRRWRERCGVWIFHLKPNMHGRVIGSVDGPVVHFPMADRTGLLEPKIMRETLATIRQVGQVFKNMGATTILPNPDTPDAFLKPDVTLRMLGAGLFHSQGTCRAGASAKDSVVDSNCMSHDIANLMCCDASVIPNHINANSNAMVMAVASKCAEFVNRQIL
jgi:choline dehydrogenase-like flavoprotein